MLRSFRSYNPHPEKTVFYKILSIFCITVYSLYSLLLHPCTVLASDETIRVRDMAGREILIPANPKKITGLSASIVEIVYSLGKGSLLVGAVAHSDFPAEAAGLPKIGSYDRPDIERLLSVKPDLCIAMMDGNPEDSVKRISSLGIPVFVVDTSGLDGIYRSISELGRILHADSEAEIIITDMKKRISAVQARVKKTGKKPGVIFEVNEEPLIVAGKGNFIDEMINIAGGLNLAADSVEYPRISREKAVAAMPDVVIISGMIEEKREKIWWNNFRHVPAVKNGRVHLVSPDIFLRPTPRIVDCIEKLAGFIHPEIQGSLF